MPTRIRLDEPGSFHHVVNRGAAHRPVFEFDRDVRKFLSLLARVVRDGLIELRAYALLTTHFHLYVRSLTGQLAAAMQRVEQPYVQWFNRVRERDGSLFASRFWSRRIFVPPDERAVIDYIHRNPVDAGLARRPEDYPWCSAHRRALPHRTIWLSASDGRPRRRPTGSPREAAFWLVEQRIAAGRRQLADDPLRHLIRAAPAHVREWLRERELIADGASREVPIAAPMAVAEALASFAPPATPAGDAAWARLGPTAPAHVALLRRLCGLTWSAIAAATRLSGTTARDSSQLHARRLIADDSYTTWVALVAGRAIHATLGDNEIDEAAEDASDAPADTASLSGTSSERAEVAAESSP